MARSAATISSRRETRPESGAGIITGIEQLHGTFGPYTAKMPRWVRVSYGTSGVTPCGSPALNPASDVWVRPAHIDLDLPRLCPTAISYSMLAMSSASEQRPAMIKDLVVNLSAGTDSDVASEYAISVADAFRAHAFGVAFAYEPILP